MTQNVEIAQQPRPPGHPPSIVKVLEMNCQSVSMREANAVFQLPCHVWIGWQGD